MTFWYDMEADELVGNRADEYAYFEGEELHIDVEHIMEEGRAERKLREMQRAIDNALDAHAEYE